MLLCSPATSKSKSVVVFDFRYLSALSLLTLHIVSIDQWKNLRSTRADNIQEFLAAPN